jgi:hypothetical protein
VVARVKALSLAATVLTGSATIAIASDSDSVDPKPVTEDTFIRAELDSRILRFQEEGGMNRGLVYTVPTPTDVQPVPRMNRDTLYAGVPIDTKDGFTVTIPEVPDGRYASVYLLDNDHFTIDILSRPGTYKFGEQDTRYIVAIPRIQVRDPNDEEDIKVAREILDQVKFDSGSKEPKTANWDWDQMLKLRAGYEAKIRDFTQYPSTFQDTRASGNTTTEHHRIAVASSWGLFPDYETVYINYPGPAGAEGVEKCYTATYKIPDNDAFWSITMYNDEGYMFSDDRAVLNAGTTEMNDDGTFTAYFGSEEQCGDVANRLDTSEGWSFLMRVYRPGESVRAGEYVLPEITVVD